MLDSELDFRAEAQAMEKIAAGVAYTVDGNRAKPPITVPRPVPGLCSGRVLVMEYVQVRDKDCLLYTSPSPRDKRQSRMPSSA